MVVLWLRGKDGADSRKSLEQDQVETRIGVSIKSIGRIYRMTNVPRFRRPSCEATYVHSRGLEDRPRYFQTHPHT